MDAGALNMPGKHHQADKAVRTVVGAACAAMLLAALHRVAFSVLAVPIQQQFGLSLPQMGLLQSALLVGYVVGQIPLGLVADRVGGAQLLLACLFLWSLATSLFAHTPNSKNPFAFMLATRAALGLGQSCIMPAVSSLSARWLPPKQRSRYTSTIYAFFSCGTVAGLACTPFLAKQLGWPATCLVFGLVGMAYAALTVFALPSGATPHQSWLGQSRQQQQPTLKAGLAGVSPPSGSVTGGGLHGDGPAGALFQQTGPMQPQKARQRSSRVPPGTLAHLLTLCFVHSVISWAFFVLQSWLPTFFHSLGAFGSLESVGVLSALPWLATAGVSVVAGSLADWAQARRQLPALTVRRTMQSIATLGAALSLVPLALLPSAAVPAPVAVVLLTLAVASQGFNYSGFHSYVQDVAPRDAGLVLGITNTCGTLVGIVGNVVTGYLAGGPLGYQAVFAITVILQAASYVLWMLGARGEALQLT
ncbi:hypothetical protein N2152v2_010857 [Parachlorella kessleri]